jgi:hypothetical protein
MLASYMIPGFSKDFQSFAKVEINQKIEVSLENLAIPRASNQLEFISMLLNWNS